MNLSYMDMGKNINVVKETPDYIVFKLTSETGEGIMTCHEVFPGILIIYNNFDIKYCYSDFKASDDMFFIEHCKEGRIQWDIGSGKYIYMRQGDLRIDNVRSHEVEFEFPLNHYVGISIAFCGDDAEKSLENMLEGFPIKLSKLKEKFCNQENSYILKSQTTIEHIFSELYSIPNEIKKYYLKVKVLELLLFLAALDISCDFVQTPYFYKTQVEKIKAIEKFITDNIEVHYTLNELTEIFDISLTTMKSCFKGVYGTSIYSYIRMYRMNTAASMLRKTNKSIISIASEIGYESQSKFTEAFKKVIGKTPLKYRKSIV